MAEAADRMVVKTVVVVKVVTKEVVVKVDYWEVMKEVVAMVD